MNRPKAILSWSSGKDCAFALHVAKQSSEVEIVGVLTTITDVIGYMSFLGLGALFLL